MMVFVVMTKDFHSHSSPSDKHNYIITLMWSNKCSRMNYSTILLFILLTIMLRRKIYRSMYMPI